jgi:hypothetical protein
MWGHVKRPVLVDIACHRLLPQCRGTGEVEMVSKTFTGAIRALCRGMLQSLHSSHIKNGAGLEMVHTPAM